MAASEQQAYAKIVGPGWKYYMTKPKIILGRGGKGVDCDVQVSNESPVSRQHFSIRYAPEHESMEIENMSKNGILVNGEFKQIFSSPKLIKSQTEISFGRFDKMRLTVVLPIKDKVINKKNGKHIVKHHHQHILKLWNEKGYNINNIQFLPLLNCIAYVILTYGHGTDDGKGLDVNDIVKWLKSCKDLQSQQFKLVKDFGLLGNVRHVIIMNPGKFKIVGSDGPSNGHQHSKFAITEQSLPVFQQFARLLNSEQNAKKPTEPTNIPTEATGTATIKTNQQQPIISTANNNVAAPAS